MAVPKQPNPWLKQWPWFALLLIVVFAMAVRIRIADMPLERDEGEYAYAGQLILQGIPPYKLAYNMKLPGTYAMYAGLMSMFGETARGIHLGMALINSITIILVFLLGKRLFDALTGVAAAATFAVLSNSHTLLAMAAHANHFVVLFAVAGLLSLLYAQSSTRFIGYFWSGLLLGLAFLMKQQGIFFAVFAVLAIVGNAWTNRPLNWKACALKIGVLALGCLIPFAITCGLLWRAGVFEKFWFWTFRYAREYVSVVSLPQGVGLFWRSFSAITAYFWPIYIFPVTGVLIVFVLREDRLRGLWLLALSLLSFCGVAVGLYFRYHYFLLALPAVCLFVGVAVSHGRKLLPQQTLYQGIPVLLFATALGGAIYLGRGPLFYLPPAALMQALYAGNPFLKTEAIGQYIRQHSAPDARVAVLGSEPEIYFTSRRHSATGYIYMYGLMEPQPFALEMQKEMIREMEAAEPQFIVMVEFEFSWLRRRNSYPLILDWTSSYLPNRYHAVAVLDYISPTQIEEAWGPDAARREPHGDDFVIVFERNASPK